LISPYCYKYKYPYKKIHPDNLLNWRRPVEKNRGPSTIKLLAPVTVDISVSMGSSELN